MYTLKRGGLYVQFFPDAGGGDKLPRIRRRKKFWMWMGAYRVVIGRYGPHHLMHCLILVADQ